MTQITIKVQNNGPDTANKVIVSFHGLDLINIESSSASKGSLQETVWVIGEMQKDEQSQLTLNASPIGDEAVFIDAVVSSYSLDMNVTNNTATFEVTSQPSPQGCETKLDIYEGLPYAQFSIRTVPYVDRAVEYEGDGYNEFYVFDIEQGDVLLGDFVDTPTDYQWWDAKIFFSAYDDGNSYVVHAQSNLVPWDGNVSMAIKKQSDPVGSMILYHDRILTGIQNEEQLIQFVNDLASETLCVTATSNDYPVIPPVITQDNTPSSDKLYRVPVKFEDEEKSGSDFQDIVDFSDNSDGYSDALLSKVILAYKKEDPSNNLGHVMEFDGLKSLYVLTHQHDQTEEFVQGTLGILMELENSDNFNTFVHVLNRGEEQQNAQWAMVPLDSGGHVDNMESFIYFRMDYGDGAPPIVGGETPVRDWTVEDYGMKVDMIEYGV